MPTLIIQDGSEHRGGTFEWPLLIGSCPANAVMVADNSVAHVHAWIGVGNNGYFVANVTKAGRTHVNGIPVQGRRLLSDGDVIQVGGSVKMRFQAEDALPKGVRPVAFPWRAPNATLPGERESIECGCGASILMEPPAPARPAQTNGNGAAARPVQRPAPAMPAKPAPARTSPPDINGNTAVATAPPRIATITARSAAPAPITRPASPAPPTAPAAAPPARPAAPPVRPAAPAPAPVRKPPPTPQPRPDSPVAVSNPAPAPAPAAVESTVMEAAPAPAAPLADEKPAVFVESLESQESLVESRLEAALAAAAADEAHIHSAAVVAAPEPVAAPIPVVEAAVATVEVAAAPVVVEEIVEEIVQPEPAPVEAKAESVAAVAVSAAAVAPEKPSLSLRSEPKLVMCAICQSRIDTGEQMTTCSECHLTFHEECWAENKGCAAYGCGNVNVLASPESVPVKQVDERELVDPFPWEFLLLGASVVSLVAGALAFGVPSAVLGLATLIVAVHKRLRRWPLLATCCAMCFIGLIVGIEFSKFWWLGIRPFAWVGR
ncbi:MAG TPA: FHA domain-containing protein [Tepidisphaeraceae bacterium]|jgi:pSer/pThr/pTyr-binding forkhead associated (FHA) protein